MNNMGGLTRLYVVDADYYDSIELKSENLYDIIFGSGYEMERISFIEDTGKISQTEEETDNGTLYNIEVSFIIAAAGPANADPLKGLRNKKIILLAYDSNDQIWLAGQPGSYFNVTVNSTTGTAAMERNSRSVKITAQLSISAVFIDTIS
jgi:hypothetical protein